MARYRRAMRLKKAILNVGTYQSPDGEIVVTPGRLRGWASSFATMRRRNLGIPVGVDHSDDIQQTVPVAFSTEKNKKRSAINGVGWLDSFTVAPDGKSAEIVLDIGDDTAAAKAKGNLLEVSPIIYPTWRDGQGREYRDVITHVDLVHHPVDASQGKFEQVAETPIACCLRMSVDVGQPSPVVFRMAKDFTKDNEDGSEEGEEATSMAADESGDEAGEKMPVADAEPVNPDLPAEPPADRLQLDALIGILAKLGYALPADTSADTIVRDLLTVFKNADAMQSKADAAGQADDDAEEETQINEASPQFAAMSLKANAAHEYAQGLHRQNLSARISGLLKTGRCTAAEAKARGEQAGAVRLSLGADNRPAVSKTEDWISDREQLPAGAVWDPTTKLQRMSAAMEESAPGIDTDLTGDGITDAAAEKIVDKLFRKPAAV